MSRLKLGIPLFLIPLILCQAHTCFGQTSPPNPKKFRYERTVIPGAPGSNRLRIDAVLMAGGNSSWQFLRQTTGSEREPMIIATGGLKDLRLYDSSNREVPYLLISPPTPEPQWINGELSPVADTKRTSGFQIDLGRPLLMDQLRLSGLPAPFVKRCTLEASNDASRWIRLRDDATVFDLPAEKLRLLEIELPETEFRFIKATWDDSASPRLPLPQEVSVRLVSAGALPPRLEVPLQIHRRASEPGVSRYRIRLPAPRPPVTQIRLSTTGGNVLRQARITEGRLSGEEIVPALLGTALLRREVRGDAAAAQMSVPVTPPQEAQLDLVIEDGDNPPLDITEATAVFAYLPWIYFESADGGTLTARYGYGGLNEPRYDLEAARASAEKAQTAEARWESERSAAIEAESPVDSGLPEAGSAIDVGSFRYARNIISHKPGLSSLPLDAAVLAHSRIADLRIAGPDGRQIPYLMEKADEPLSLDLPPLEKTESPRAALDNKSVTASRSFYRLRLPFQNLPPARLVFSTSGRVFRRNLRVLIEKNPYNERQEPWTTSIAAATWAHADPETPAQALMLRIPTLKTTEVLVIIEEGDNSPLPVTSVKLLLPAQRLRFFRGSEPDLKLYYGRNDLAGPRYDLAMLAPRLVGAAAEEIRLGPEVELSAVAARQISPKIFWGILIAAVLVLLVLIVRLVKK
ncbi:MAG: DUF3999 family protein [Acidobacteria bacterium]|nr:DUF3999 family protein [Acidobacteriota bacterium]